jgi:hypothetical protein
MPTILALEQRGYRCVCALWARRRKVAFGSESGCSMNSRLSPRARLADPSGARLVAALRSELSRRRLCAPQLSNGPDQDSRNRIEHPRELLPRAIRQAAATSACNLESGRPHPIYSSSCGATKG